MNPDLLTCIDLDQPSLEGFRQFISCWLYQDEKLCFVVDPGPLSTIPVLLKELQKQQVKSLDYILLTHIHIDHAGGTGELLRTFPQTKVICHPNGIKHLIAPEKLWAGSKKFSGSSLKNMARSFRFQKQILNLWKRSAQQEFAVISHQGMPNTIVAICLMIYCLAAKLLEFITLLRMVSTCAPQHLPSSS